MLPLCHCGPCLVVKAILPDIYLFRAELVFNLGTEDLKGAERVVEVIEDLTYKNSWTRTAEAMELVRTMVFHPSNGMYTYYYFFITKI